MIPSILAASRAAFLAPPIATVATGTPYGIWTMESRESTPPTSFVGIGTPMTGRGVREAVIPGRCAAPPAPAIITSIPLEAADLAYSNIRSGVLCAETTLASYGIPRDLRTSAASLITGQSLLLPIIMPTSGPTGAGGFRSLKSVLAPNV